MAYKALSKLKSVHKMMLTLTPSRMVSTPLDMEPVNQYRSIYLSI
jgi:hypothetical protein